MYAECFRDSEPPQAYHLWNYFPPPKPDIFSFFRLPLEYSRKFSIPWHFLQSSRTNRYVTSFFFFFRNFRSVLTLKRLTSPARADPSWGGGTTQVASTTPNTKKTKKYLSYHGFMCIVYVSLNNIINSICTRILLKYSGTTRATGLGSRKQKIIVRS